MYSHNEIKSNNRKGVERVSNKNASDYVNDKAEFQGNNTFSEYINGVYIVYSYGYHFPLFVYKDGNWYANNEKYSSTISKHYSQLCPNEKIYRYCNTELMKKLPYISELQALTI